MKYFITGGTGFLGAHTIRALLAAGHEVTTFDIAPDRTFLREVLDGEPRGLEILHGDVADGFAVLRALRESQAQRVVHLAGVLSLQCDANPIKAIRVNCEGTLNVFEAALASGVQRVVWASSIGVFGTPGEARGGPKNAGRHFVLGNDDPHQPVGVYGACKSFNERLARHYARFRGLQAIGLRFANSYGYGKGLTVQRGTRVGFMSDLIDNPALGRPGTVDHGDAVMDWLYAADAARGVLLASEAGDTTATAVNICGQRYSIAEIAGFMREIVPGASIEVRPGSWGDNLEYDTTAAQQQIGYAPAVDIRTGLRENVNTLRRLHGLEPV